MLKLGRYPPQKIQSSHLNTTYIFQQGFFQLDHYHTHTTRVHIHATNVNVDANVVYSRL